MDLCKTCGFEIGGVLCEHYTPCQRCGKPTLLGVSFCGKCEATLFQRSFTMQSAYVRGLITVTVRKNQYGTLFWDAKTESGSRLMRQMYLGSLEGLTPEYVQARIRRKLS